jgi:hypothetical protein
MNLKRSKKIDYKSAAIIDKILEIIESDGVKIASGTRTKCLNVSKEEIDTTAFIDKILENYRLAQL